METTGDPGCCATTEHAHDLVCPAVTKASFDLQFPKLSSQTDMAHQVRGHDLPLIIKDDRRHRDCRPHGISQHVLIALLPKRCARSTSAAQRYANGWRHATDPPHSLRPRKAATSRGPNSSTSKPHIRHELWRTQARSFVCSCTTACDDFTTVSAVGIPVFILDASAWTRRPRHDPLRALRQTFKFAARGSLLSAEPRSGS